MASPSPKCPKHETVSEHPTHTEKCPQGGGKIEENGAQKEKKVVPEVDIVGATPVNWDPVDQLQPSPYIDYKVIIVNERTPDLFPPLLGQMNFIGALYTFSAGGVSLPAPRAVFLDAGDPANLVMRVPQSDADESTVLMYYSWSRMNFVFQDNSNPHPKHIFQLFTPANLGTHGAIASEGETVFIALPEGNKVEDVFTYFQIETGQNQDHITNEAQTLGLYVDTSDSWKIKATSTTSLWDKFTISGFITPPIFTNS